MKIFAAVLVAGVLALSGCQMGSPSEEVAVDAGPREKVVPAPDRAPPRRPADLLGPVVAPDTSAPDGASAEQESVPEAEATDAQEAVAEQPEAEPAPEKPIKPVVVTPEQRACERRGGNYVGAVGGKYFTCLFTPSDAGKSCKKATDCKGECLARSLTCAPVMPLFGCHEILNNSGQRETQCLQ